VQTVSFFALGLLIAPMSTQAHTVVADAFVGAGGITTGSHVVRFSAGVPAVGLASAHGFSERSGFWSWWLAPPLLPVDAPPSAIPVRTALHPNRPNPFNPTTRVAFDLAGAAGATIPVDLRVFDATGRLVTLLVAERLAPGSYEVSWEGRDDRGRSIESGVYYARLRAGHLERRIRLVLLK
jgi:hypothetical protein